MRFLLRWQHVTPDTQLSGEAGLIAVLEQLQGFEAAARAWEPELFSRRIRQYQPAWLDALCHAGEVAWLRLTPRACDEQTSISAAAPSKATPTGGLVRGGRFVGGFSGEQYALPGAVEQLARLRRAPRTQECVVLNATDPLNLVGLIVPGEAVPAVRTNHVAYVDGLPGDRAATARMVTRLEGERIARR